MRDGLDNHDTDVNEKTVTTSAVSTLYEKAAGKRRERRRNGASSILFWNIWKHLNKWGRGGQTLLLPGEMNILQIQCKFDFNTFLFCKSYKPMHIVTGNRIGGLFWLVGEKLVILVIITNNLLAICDAIFGDFWGL